jgi:hypothetical protein
MGGKKNSHKQMNIKFDSKPITLVITTIIIATLPVLLNALSYEPTLQSGEVRHLTLTKQQNSSVLFFRIRASDFISMQWFHFSVSACTGLIKLYKNQCSPSEQSNCDDGTSSDWFPTSKNANASQYIVYLGGLAQPTLSFGKLPTTQQYGNDTVEMVYFFGVQVYSWDKNDQSQIDVSFRCFNTNQSGDYGLYLSDNSLHAAKLGITTSFTWDQALFCQSIKNVDGIPMCNSFVNITETDSRYYIFYRKLPDANFTNVNMGTTCGLRLLTSNAQRKYVGLDTGTALTFDHYSNDTIYLVNVALMRTGNNNSSLVLPDFAYRPLKILVESERSIQRTAFIIILVLGSVAIVAVVIFSIIVAHFCQIKERLSEQIALNNEERKRSLTSFLPTFTRKKSKEYEQI